MPQVELDRPGLALCSLISVSEPRNCKIRTKPPASRLLSITAAWIEPWYACNVLTEVEKIQNELELKEYNLELASSQNQQLSEDLEYYKNEFNRVEALLRVMESRAANMRNTLGDDMGTSTAPCAPKKGHREGERPSQRQSGVTYGKLSTGSELGSCAPEKRRWIPPTGFQWLRAGIALKYCEGRVMWDRGAKRGRMVGDGRENNSS